jgi:hypothetical protein
LERHREDTIMNEDIRSERVWTKVVGSAALGAAAMFVLDPDKGRRRRALARDKANWVARRTSEIADAAARDLRGRLQGVGAQTARRLRGNDRPGDDVLRERVRAKLGRSVSHPHAVRVEAQQGRVVLSGPILASEIDGLLSTVRAVPGVVDVEQRLESHQTPERIPALQGVPRREARSGMRRGWTPGGRFGAMIGGGFLAAYGLGRGGLSGLVVLALGAGLVSRVLAEGPLDELVDVAPGDTDIATNQADRDRDLPIVQSEPTPPMPTPPADAPTMAGTPGA